MARLTEAATGTAPRAPRPLEKTLGTRAEPRARRGPSLTSPSLLGRLVWSPQDAERLGVEETGVLEGLGAARAAASCTAPGPPSRAGRGLGPQAGRDTLQTVLVTSGAVSVKSIIRVSVRGHAVGLSHGPSEQDKGRSLGTEGAAVSQAPLSGTWGEKARGGGGLLSMPLPPFGGRCLSLAEPLQVVVCGSAHSRCAIKAHCSELFLWPVTRCLCPGVGGSGWT